MAMWAGIIFYRSRDTAKKTPNNAVVLILLHLRPFLALITGNCRMQFCGPRYQRTTYTVFVI